MPATTGNAMEIGDIFHAGTREEWRAWLASHHDRRPEIWLVRYRKASGVPCVEYDDAVEEALCFGWIDSTQKRLDEDRTVQRYSPRRAGSAYSQTNRERLARLIAAGHVHPRVLESLPDDVDPERYTFPADVLAALRADADAWSNWNRFPPAYRRIRAAYVDAARDRGAEFDRRLENLVRKTAQGKQFGYGIEKFY